MTSFPVRVSLSATVKWLATRARENAANVVRPQSRDANTGSCRVRQPRPKPDATGDYEAPSAIHASAVDTYVTIALRYQGSLTRCQIVTVRTVSSMQFQEVERNWVNVLFLLLVPQRGMQFQPTYAASMTLLHLNVNLRLICLPWH